MFYTDEELQKIGFKSLGKNVKISTLSSIYTPEKIEIGNNSRIDDFCLLNGKIKLGNNVHLAAYSYVDGNNVGITFEDYSGLAYKSMAFTDSDDYVGFALSNPTVPVEYRAPKVKPVLIKKHCLVGAGSIILPGVTLETGTAIGAMSLVKKSTEEWSIYGGNPAQRLSKRFKKLLKLEQEYIDNVKPND